GPPPAARLVGDRPRHRQPRVLRGDRLRPRAGGLVTASRPLLGKVALVTGAARRIGRETALALAEGGAHVAIHARQSLREADALARRIRRGGRRAAVLAADLADPDQCERLVPACVKALGRLDVLVNNAAIFEATDPRRADAA